MSDSTTTELRAMIEEQEAAIDKKFVDEFNALCEKYKRTAVAVPVLVPDSIGMKISAQIQVQRQG